VIVLDVDEGDAAAIMAEIESETLDLQCEVAAYVRNRAVEYTPRRRGVAAASWRTKVGGIDSSAEKEGSTHAKPVPIAASELRPKAKLGRAINVTNNLWRVGFLEDGTVKNKPAKMAARAVTDTEARFSG
jgi:hypothetical protein